MGAKSQKPLAPGQSPPKASRMKTTATRLPASSQKQYKDEIASTPAVAVLGDPSPYQGTAPLRHVQQSPNLNNSQGHNQQQYPVQNVFNQQGGLQSPYLNNSQYHQPAPAGENAYFHSNPSPRSTHSTAYYPTEKSDSMASAAAMQRPYPPMYHTPQSNSPASVTSPQTHDHGRPLFSQQGAQLSPPMFPYSSFQPLNQIGQSPYGSAGQSHMGGQPLMHYQSNAGQVPPAQVPSHSAGINTSPRTKQEPPQSYSQTPQSRPSMTGQQHPTPSQTPAASGYTPNQPPNPASTSNAAPGPIPATTPLVVRQDGNGVQWIAFEYSRDRIKMEYTIRCDVESVDTSSLLQEFKSENCVYPRACVPKDQYKGNRLNYESDCNQVGWALAELNPCLRGKRGLIQRAVDSWRNSNQDPRLRSRRVRRQAKIHNKSKFAPTPSNQASTSPGQVGSSGHPSSTGVPASTARAPISMPTSSQQIHHHHAQHDISPTGPDSAGASSYVASTMNRTASASQNLSSPQHLRHAQTFPGYQAYPTVPSSMAPSMAPPLPGGMHQFNRPPGNAAMVSKDRDERDDEDSALFGDVPEGKRRKFILVEDTQKNARVRVKVTLDQIEISEVPDSYRKNNSVFPRVYYPIQMQSTGEALTSSRFTDEDMDEMDDGPPTLDRTTVSCTTTDGDVEVEVPQLSRGKRGREQRLNELGYRMAWGQSRVFSNRPVFLGRALDAYRNKQRSALVGSGQIPSSIPPHLETRPGKRRWLERTRPAGHSVSQPQLKSE